MSQNPGETVRSAEVFATFWSLFWKIQEAGPATPAAPAGGQGPPQPPAAPAAPAPSPPEPDLSTPEQPPPVPILL